MQQVALFFLRGDAFRVEGVLLLCNRVALFYWEGVLFERLW